MAIAVDTASIENETHILPLSALARYLQGTLGQRVTAYMTGLKDPKMVGRWASGKGSPRPPADMRLRYAYVVTRLLTDAYGPETARSWLFGSNTHLDEAPAYLLRYAQTPDDLRFVVPVARAFAAGAD